MGRFLEEGFLDRMLVEKGLMLSSLHYWVRD